MSCKNKCETIPEAAWQALALLPSLRFMKPPVEQVTDLYERYRMGEETGVFALVTGENCFYRYRPESRLWTPAGGYTAYQVWVQIPGNEGKSVEEFIEALRGLPGMTAYEVWLAEGNTGTFEDFLATLKGAVGDDPYEVWLAEGHTGTLNDFLATLRGPRGDRGAPGVQGDMQDAPPVVDLWSRIIRREHFAERSLLPGGATAAGQFFLFGGNHSAPFRYDPVNDNFKAMSGAPVDDSYPYEGPGDATDGKTYFWGTQYGLFVLESPEDDSLEATSITTRVNSMVLASDGKTYFSPDAGGLYVLNDGDGSLSPVPGVSTDTRFTGGGVSAAGDTFFFATYGEQPGVWYLNNISGTVYPTTLSGASVGSMFNAPDGNTYFLTSGDGIYKISGAYAPGAILPTNLTSVNFAGEGAGHLTTPGGKTYVWGDGLYRLDAGGLFTSVSSAGGFRAFAVASDGRVYFVNNTGAYRLDPSDDTLTLWWMDNQVRDVAVDAEGNLFFLCIYDIWCYDEVTDGRVTVVASNGHGFNAFAHSPFGELYALPGGAEPDHRLMRLPMIAFLRMPGEWVPVRITPQMVAGGG